MSFLQLEQLPPWHEPKRARFDLRALMVATLRQRRRSADTSRYNKLSTQV